MWIGLAARDSLRLEAGLCLHGQDITPEINPVDAGLMWAIPKSIRSDGQFEGAGALRAALAAGPARKRVGLKPEGRQPVRAGAVLIDDAGEPIGEVTSGGFGPSVGHPVAMGYVSGRSQRARQPRLMPRFAARRSRSTSIPSPSRPTAIAKERSDVDRPISRKIMNGSASKAASRPSASPTMRRSSWATSSSSNCRKPAARSKRATSPSSSNR